MSQCTYLKKKKIIIGKIVTAAVNSRLFNIKWFDEKKKETVVK